MKEKINNLLSNGKLKEFSKKIFTKKKMRILIAAVALAAVLRIGYLLAFTVDGTVLKINGNSIVVTNFLGTKTVNLGDYPIDSSRINAGQKVEITKNISGDVISVRTGGGRRNGNSPFGQPGDRAFGQAQNGFNKGRNKGQFQVPNNNNQGQNSPSNQSQGQNGQAAN